MSKLYGYLTGDRGAAQTKASGHVIEAIVQNTSARLTLTLWDDGRYDLTTKTGSPGSYHTEKQVVAGNLTAERGDGRSRDAERSARRR